MPTSDLRRAYFDILMEQVRSARYPSPTMMDRLEKEVRDLGTAEEYVRILLDLMAEERFPSPMMLERMSQAISAIEGAARAS